MKSLTFILTFFLVTSCISKKQYQRDSDGDGVTDEYDMNPQANIFLLYSDFNKELKSIVGDDLPVPEGKPKSLEDELYQLFNPESFNCGCDLKLKKNIAKLNNDKGYLPNEIKVSVTGLTGNHLERRGSNNLLNSFYIRDNKGRISKRIFAKNSPTAQNYDVLDYLVTLTHSFNNLYYTIDCSGYLAGVISAGIGISGNSIKASSNSAILKKTSLVVIKGVLCTPLFQAIKGENKFGENKELRKKVIAAILDKVPADFNDDESEIIINENYDVLLTSNTGNSSFNGKAELSAGGSYNFIFGGLNTSINSAGSIGRLSNFSEFNTYILNSNIDDYPIVLKLKDLRNLLTTL